MVDKPLTQESGRTLTRIAMAVSSVDCLEVHTKIPRLLILNLQRSV